MNPEYDAITEGPFDFEIARRRLADYLAARQAGRAESLRMFPELMLGGSLGDRVAAWQQVRDAGLLPPSAATFLIMSCVEDEAEAGEEDETFLEPEEEDGSDMENIIGGPVAETDEPQ